MKYDFCGWATKNNLKCADGLTIKNGAFQSNNGKTVPLVWNHKHDSVNQVLGHAVLESRDEGIYAYCSFNNTSAGKEAREVVQHGDVVSLSIWANNIQQIGKDVIHGVIREVSLVLAGANPGAYVESVVQHGMPMDDGDEEAIFYSGEGIIISHASDESEPEKKDGENSKSQEDTGDDDKKKGKTVKDVIETMNEEQKKAMAIVVGQAIIDAKRDAGKPPEEKEEKEVKHNIFEGAAAARSRVTFSKDDMRQLFEEGKRLGSLKAAVKSDLENDGFIAHALDTTGMEKAKGTQNYGVNDVDMLFPDYKSLNTPPEFISRNMDWVSKVLSRVHHTPFSRIKSQFANITEDEARARGYIKGKQKKTEVFTTLKRTTDPQTIYKFQKMDRDDILDITDFDVLAWIKAEMRVMLDEEVARAILIGDGREADAEDKIQEIHVRPIASDVPLFNTVVKVTVSATATEAEIAKATIRAIIKSRKQYKGSGRPDFWTTDDPITEMLLLEDNNGRSIYDTEAVLSTKLRVNEIIPVEPMEGHKITVDGKEYPLIGIMSNLSDYNVGADKGGEVTMFENFDLNFNKQEYLLETRISGALVKPFSAVTFVLDRTAAG